MIPVYVQKSREKKLDNHSVAKQALDKNQKIIIITTCIRQK